MISNTDLPSKDYQDLEEYNLIGTVLKVQLKRYDLKKKPSISEGSSCAIKVNLTLEVLLSHPPNSAKLIIFWFSDILNPEATGS